jgi:hypothetical protein
MFDHFALDPRLGARFRVVVLDSGVFRDKSSLDRADNCCLIDHVISEHDDSQRACVAHNSEDM